MSRSLNLLYPLAEAQVGHFTTRQAHGVGISDQQLHYLARTGSLQRVAHGIYRFHRFPFQPLEDVVVACLWAGAGAAASHDTALVVYDLTDAMPGTIHVTVPRRFRGRRPGVTVHTTSLPERDRTSREGVPVTTPTRTIRDIWARYGTDRTVETAREFLDSGLISRRRLRRDLASDEQMRGIIGKLEAAP